MRAETWFQSSKEEGDMVRTGRIQRSLAAIGMAVGLLGAGGVSAQDIKMWSLADSGGEKDFVAGAAAAFEELHPGVNIIHEQFPNEAYKTQIQIALSGSEPPDVFFNWSGEDAARLVRDGLALNITEYGNAEDGFAQFVGEGWLSSFAYDGHYYGVPTHAVSKYFYYNKPFFDEHGLSEPQTFSELVGLCRSIREVDPNIVPWPLGNNDRWKLNHLITMINHRVLGDEGTAEDYALTAPADELFTDAGYVEAWEHVLELQEAGCFEDAPNATAHESANAMFSAEASPMIYCGTWCSQQFHDEGFTDFAMFRLPGIEGGAGDPGAGFLVPSGYQVSAKTEHPEIAAAWLSFLVNDENAAKFAAAMETIPSNPTLIDTVEGSDHYKWIAADMAKATGAVNVLDVLLENSVSNAYLDGGVEILNGSKTPEEVMADIRAVALEAQSKLGL